MALNYSGRRKRAEEDLKAETELQRKELERVQLIWLLLILSILQEGSQNKKSILMEEGRIFIVAIILLALMLWKNRNTYLFWFLHDCSCCWKHIADKFFKYTAKYPLTGLLNWRYVYFLNGLVQIEVQVLQKRMRSPMQLFRSVYAFLLARLFYFNKEEPCQPSISTFICQNSPPDSDRTFHATPTRAHLKCPVGPR